MQREQGFSLIEFLVTMALLVLLFTAAFEIFVPVISKSKTEAGNTQTQIEGIIGLELLRRDVVGAGGGIPWYLPTTTPVFQYNETSNTGHDNFNDGTAAGIASNSPRAVIAQNNMSVVGLGKLNNSDYLVIKSASVANPQWNTGSNNAVDNPAGDKWTTIQNVAGAGIPRVWNDTSYDPAANDLVIVVQPANGSQNMLLTTTAAGASWFTKYSTLNAAPFIPPSAGVAWYVFGMDSQGLNTLRRPFNRADYYVSTQNVPARCAPGTGVLVKTVMRQDGDTWGPELPLLDCVATFQVALAVDNTIPSTADDGISDVNCITNDITTLGLPVDATVVTTGQGAKQVRDAVKEIRIYILAQEGDFDLTYKYDKFNAPDPPLPQKLIRVGETNPSTCSGGSASCNCTGAPDTNLGVDFDLATIGNATYPATKFRWRVFKMTIKPESVVTTTAFARNG